MAIDIKNKNGLLYFLQAHGLSPQASWDDLPSTKIVAELVGSQLDNLDDDDTYLIALTGPNSQETCFVNLADILKLAAEHVLQGIREANNSAIDIAYSPD